MDATNKDLEYAIVSAGEHFFTSEKEPVRDFHVEWKLIFLGLSKEVLRVGYQEIGIVDDGQKTLRDVRHELTFLLPANRFVVKNELFEVTEANNERMVVLHRGKARA